MHTQVKLQRAVGRGPGRITRKGPIDALSKFSKAAHCLVCLLHIWALGNCCGVVSLRTLLATQRGHSKLLTSYALFLPSHVTQAPQELATRILAKCQARVTKGLFRNGSLLIAMDNPKCPAHAGADCAQVMWGKRAKGNCNGHGLLHIMPNVQDARG